MGASSSQINIKNMSLKIRWLGHAGFRISFTDPKDGTIERVIYIDAWLGASTLS